MSKDNVEIIDFGFKPEESFHHFLVLIPKAKEQDIIIFEQFDYDDQITINALQHMVTGAGSTAKILLSRKKWDLIESELRAEFNRRLKGMNLKSAKWKKGKNYLHRLFGKELMVLAWAIEDTDPGTIPLAIENWLGLRPEERWWLFTMTNAATGHAIRDRNKGWRKALRFALTENPVSSSGLDSYLNEHRKNLPLFGDEDTIESFS
ncbi:DUF3780 domain-containing protein [Rhodohalobacter mucosus]|uniref:DUF3780 domain-containing protein n=1 Tax=Rhodohalobacter mucosus TaxID=2079485 RepID=UPI0018EE836D|nr:DUF3780 domain-containing protein [Rhodohalobacter mucosus]